MGKYFFRNKTIAMLYIFFSIITYTCLSLVFHMYSLITKATGQMSLPEAYRITFISAAVLVILLLMLNILAVLKRFLLFEITKSLRQDVFTRMSTLSLPDYFTQHTSHYSSILLNDLDTLEEDYFATILELIGDTVQLLIMLFSIYLIGPSYLFLVLLFCIPSVIQPFIMKGKLGRLGLKVSQEMSRYTGKVQEYIHSFELVRTFRREPLIKKLFERDVQKLEHQRQRQSVAKVLNMTLVILAVYLLKVGSQLYFTYAALGGLISVATVSLLFGLANNVGNPLASILGYFTTLSATSEVRAKITDLLSIETEDNIQDSSLRQLEQFNEEIVLQQAGFSYGGHPVLREITFRFVKGKKYALIGKSGSGKSTLLRLIMGYHNEAYKGSIRIDSQEVRELDPSSLWSHIAVIHQNVFIMEGTLRDNITLFNNTYNEEQIATAVGAAGLTTMVDALPEGLDTIITEGGKNFSGGEKQRIAIARACITDAQILLIDEGTSALDNITAVEIEHTLLALEGKTIISIVHRINETIRDYDEICILDDGEIVRFGPYEELMRHGGIYPGDYLEEGGVGA